MLKFYWDYELKKTLNMASSGVPQLSCTRASNGICPLAYNEGNHQLKSPNYLYNWPMLSILQGSHPNYFFLRKLLFRLHNHCEIFIDLAEGIMAFIFIAGCGYSLCTAKSNYNSVWSDQTRQDTCMQLSKHFRGHRFWSSRMVYRGCIDVDCKS